MPHRIISQMNGIGDVVDLSVFASAFAVIGGAIIGMDVSEAGALLTGTAALIIATGRWMRYAAEAKKLEAEAKVQESLASPELYQQLMDLRCWNAPECPDRAFYKPHDHNDE